LSAAAPLPGRRAAGQRRAANLLAAGLVRLATLG